MGRLIVVSNRVPLPDRAGNPPAGGLAVAVHAALQERGGLWLGWSGRSIGNREPGPLNIIEHGPIRYALTDLSRKDVNEYYNGLANRVLWPIFHGRLDLAEYSLRDMAAYFSVNRLFADRLLPLLRRDDVIWIHDYHLIPLAAELRKHGITNKIGFFLHIPWPPPDILFAMPVYDTLLRSLSAYDLIGFQTDYDLDNFASCLRRENAGEPLGDGLFQAYGRKFIAAPFPIGIETEDFAELATRAVNERMVRDMRHSLGGKDLIIGVDRLDYSKGITQRIDAFERFLTNNPADTGNVTLLQISPESRSEVPEYQALQDATAVQCGRVNGHHGTVDWVPIRYVNKSIKRPVLAGLYREARIGLVTPLRDGMNLVAKEYVAAQNPEDPGVLVLSRFAGAARELYTGAIIVNPYDTDQVASAIGRALSMPQSQRVERWEVMMQRLREYDVMDWSRDFLNRLSQTASITATPKSGSPTELQ